MNRAGLGWIAVRGAPLGTDATPGFWVACLFGAVKITRAEACSSAPITSPGTLVGRRKIFGVTLASRFRGVFRLPDAGKP